MTAKRPSDDRIYRDSPEFNKRNLLEFLWRRIQWTFGKRAPFFAYLKVTRRCNLDCPYCPWHTTPTNFQGELSTDQWRSVIDMLASQGVKIMVFEGGEPTLRRDMSDLLSYAHKHSIYTILATNGMTNMWKFSPTAFTVSIDGPKDVHDSVRGSGSFDRIMNNLRKNPGKPVVTITVVSRRTYPYLEDLLAEVHSLVSASGFTFQYPYTKDSANALSPPERVQVKQHLLRLKAHYSIINPTAMLRKREWTCYEKTSVSVNHQGIMSAGCFVDHVEQKKCEDCELACYQLLSALHGMNLEAWFNLNRFLLREI